MTSLLTGWVKSWVTSRTLKMGEIMPQALPSFFHLVYMYFCQGGLGALPCISLYQHRFFLTLWPDIWLGADESWRK